MSDMTLTIDGQEVTVPHGTTVFDAARIAGIAIPTLCHQQNQTPVGVCRICICDVGERALQASCVFKAEPGMVVTTNSAPIEAVRKTLYELMLSDHPSPCLRQVQSGDCELETQAAGRGIVPEDVRFRRRAVPVMSEDDSSLSIHVDYSACILCDRCIRGCSEIRDNNVIARQGKGYFTTIGFDANEPMGNSTCVSCGECMVSCPTGALTNKKIVGQNLLAQIEGPNVYSVDTEDLLALPIFKGVSGTFLELNQGAVVKRVFQPGEVIVREGDNGSTAFYILEGDCDVLLGSPRAHVSTNDDHTSFLSKMRSKLLPQKSEKRAGDRPNPTHISIDAPVDLPFDNPIAQLGPGDLFGEMTCMSFYPRSATVRAKTECVMLEMLRNVLDVMQKNKTFRAQLEANYRGRALSTHLRSVPIFAGLSEDFIDLLRDRVELVRYAPGQVICSEGDPADSFYLIRIGFVRVSQMRNSEEMVLAYLPRGGYFGEMGLLRDAARNATCTALDHVEVVRIYAPDFHEMLDRFPQVRMEIEHVARQRDKENAGHLQRATANIQTQPLHQFLAHGLMDAQSLLILDLEKCTRCDQCVKACADAHDGVTRLLRDGVRFDKYLVATSCRQCRDPLCMIGCPVGSIRRRNSLEVIIEDWCVGCGLCANNCPYGNITIHEFDRDGNDAGDHGKIRKATSCDLCHDLDEPSCVYACPHDAAHRVNPTEFFAKMLGQDLNEAVTTRPRK
ncbi:MAG TPA: cyclic nucleotide-binding domain-containing protein [Acidobacteriaceae bacterium]|nr:cyclic nucleotide-binding domain-containing protein [Acidobacteriaceae bacterium]